MAFVRELFTNKEKKLRDNLNQFLSKEKIDLGKLSEQLRDVDPGVALNLLIETKADKYGENVLHRAALKGVESLILTLFKGLSKSEIVVLLMTTDNGGDTPLHHATYKNSKGSIKVILRALLDAETATGILKVQNNKGKTVFHIAAEGGYGDAIKEMFLTQPISEEKLVALYRQTDNFGESAIHIAARAKDESVVKTMLQGILEQKLIYTLLTSQDNYGNTPMHICSQSGNHKTIQHMTNRLGNRRLILRTLKYQNKIGYSALHVATEAANSDCVSAILEKLSQANRLELLKLSVNGMTPLHCCVYSGSSDNKINALNTMLDYVRNIAELVLHKNEKYDTILHYAALHGQIKPLTAIMIRLKPLQQLKLLRNEDKKNRTPLEVATENNQNTFAKRVEELMSDALISYEKDAGDDTAFIDGKLFKDKYQ